MHELMILLKRRIISLIIVIAGVAILFSPSIAHAQLKSISSPLPILPVYTVVTPQQLITHEATYFNDGAKITVKGSLNGNIFSNPNKRYTLFIENNKGGASVVQAYLGNLYVNSSNPNVTIQIYTTSLSIEQNIMSGIAGQGNNGFASISGVVNKSLSQGGAYYYVFDVTNVVLQPR